MPGPSTGPSRGGLRGPLVEGQHVPAARGVSHGRWGGRQNMSGRFTVMEKDQQRSIHWSNLGPRGTEVWTGPDTVESAALVMTNTSGHAYCGWTEWLSRKTEQQDSDPLTDVDLCLLCQQQVTAILQQRKQLIVNAVSPISHSTTFSNIQLQPWSIVKCKCSLFTGRCSSVMSNIEPTVPSSCSWTISSIVSSSMP